MVSPMRGTLLIGGFLLGPLIAAAASAADLSATASVQGESDSNIFRIPAGLERQLAKPASDRIVTAQGLLTLDKDWNDLRIDGHAAALYTAFAHHADLDNFGYDIGANAARQGSVSSIVFAGSAQRRLASTQDVRNTGRSIQSIADAQGLVTRSLLGDFRAILGGDFTQNTDSDPRIAVSDYRRFGVRFGFGYYSPSGNVAAIEGRVARSRGLNDSPLAIGGVTGRYRSSYSERSVEGHLLYRPSVLLAFEGRIGVSDHRDHSIFHQDFTKPIGDVKLSWSPRETIEVSLAGQRSFQSSSGILSNGVRTTSATAATALQITNSLRLTADYRRSWSTYLVTVTQNGLAAGHREQIGTIEGQLAYSPGTRFTVLFDALHGQRTSPDAVYRYRQTVLSATLLTRFGPGSTSRALNRSLD